MSSLAKIIYEETGIKQSSEPDEYEEIASACRRFALHCDPRQPLTEDEINTIWRNSTHMTIVEVVRAIEAAHGIKEQK